MKKYFALLLFSLLAFCGSAQKTMTIDDVFQYFKFYAPNPGGYHYQSDGRHYVTADAQGLHVRDVQNEKFDSLLRLNLPEAARDFDQYIFSPDESKLLLRTDVEPVYRHSTRAYYYVYNFKTQQAQAVLDTAKQLFAEFSPDGRRLAFVAANNLFYKDLETGQVSRITTDGKKNAIINGLPDWLYEEEFSPADGDGMIATKWSPDGTKIAFLRFDEREVPRFNLRFYTGTAYPQVDSFKYPKVGEKNSIVSAHIYDLTTNRIWQAETGGEKDVYFPRLYWTPANELMLTRLNRRQDTLDMLLYTIPKDAGVAAEKLLYPRFVLRETDPAYVKLERENKLVFLEKQPAFILTTDNDGYSHLYLYDLNGKQLAALTPGEFDLINFYGLNETTGKFYYQTATPTPMDRQIWEGSLDGKTPPRLLTPGPGWREAAFSPTFEFYLLTESDINTPGRSVLYRLNGEQVRVVNDNQRARLAVREYGLKKRTFFKIPMPDGVQLNASMLLPANFDSTRRYPVLFDVYGGPGSQQVTNDYNGYTGAWHHLLAQNGYVVVQVDNRGTGGRGRAFEKITHLQLGKFETQDQIDAARYLGRLPFIDSTRIGIWGWSFGGYLSTSCLLKGNRVFKAAIAVAPVTNWKWYDSAYTERYMHTWKDNKTGYEENSPVNFADRLQGAYLICHGMADDNVHWQQAVEMTQALIKANKQFDTYYYPNRNHGIYGDNATRHLFTKLTRFLLENL